MIWLRRLLFRRTVKGFEHRINSLQKLMDTAFAHMMELNAKIHSLETELPRPAESLKILTDERDQWSRVYWDAFSRHEEVEIGLCWLLKDFDRR